MSERVFYNGTSKLFCAAGKLIRGYMASVSADLPPGFSPQTSGLSLFESLIDLSAEELITHFASHPEEADAVLGQSYDKRYSPSTFVEEVGEKFRVGWFDGARKSVQAFDTLAEAVTDYLLLSFGKGRLVADRPVI